MSLDEWNKESFETATQILERAMKKIEKGRKIDFIEDLLPEYKHLKEENYAVLYPAGSIKGTEKFLTSNLGFLLSSGIYDKVLVLLHTRYQNKATLEYRYGLSKNRGSCIDYRQFLELIRENKVEIILCANPTEYKAPFYKEIFNSCKTKPINPMTRTQPAFLYLKLANVAMAEEIPPKKNWTEKVLIAHPEYRLSNCRTTVLKTFGSYLEAHAQAQDLESVENASWHLGNKLLGLRVLGFDNLANLALNFAKQNPALGQGLIEAYDRYLISPIDRDILAVQNYEIADINIMAYIRLLPKKLSTIWKDTLLSSPASSSLASKPTFLNFVKLRGTDLVKIINDFADNQNAQELRRGLKQVDSDLANFNTTDAEGAFSRADEIISESINSEVRGYSRKGKISSHMLRIGKTFTSWTARAMTMLSAMLAGGSQFEWLPLTLSGTGLSIWLRENLDEITPEEIVKWWSRTWPFEDPGIGFLIWEKSNVDPSLKT